MNSTLKTSSRAISILLLFLSGSASHAHTQDQDLSSFLDQVLAAYGTPETRGGVEAYRMSGTIQTRSGSRGTWIRTFSRPERLKVLLDYGERREARILVGPDGWRATGSGGYAPVSGPLHGSMVLQALRANIPWILDEARGIAENSGPLEHQGKVLRGIQFNVGGGLLFRVYVDPDTHRVLVSQGLLEMQGFATAFETHYSDFRLVDGVLFSFSEEGFASGQKTSSTRVEEIELNPELPNSEFRPTGPIRWGDK